MRLIDILYFSIVILISVWPVQVHPLVLDLFDHPISHFIYLIGLCLASRRDAVLSLLLAMFYVVVLHARSTYPYDQQVEEEDPERLALKI
tara:strand:+ start:217 stop:486 length:270 start_codon:yes stop_codon:yes gene_type:complete